jgi:NDP-sugar pyrophosphorylase family protein/tRNA A-37 threonylcarbamoyl transferase component Bud32
MYKDIKIITLAAGKGLRLKDYSDKLDLPKPLINILNKSMIEWSLMSYHSLITKGLVKKSNFYFVILESHESYYSIVKQLKSIFGNKINIIKLKKPTRGPAETAYLAIKNMKFKGPIIFNDCDHYFKSTSLVEKIIEAKNKKNISGIINVAETNSTKPDWSYVEQDSSGNILGIKEKDPVLAKKKAKGVVASYYFSNLDIFRKEAKLMIKDNDLVGDKLKKEFYISKIYDRLIKKNHTFLTAVTPIAFPFGNPLQIQNFVKKFSKDVFYPEGSTFIFDIDGVLLEHDKGFHGNFEKYQYPSKPIIENIKLLNSFKSKGDTIVLMTARPETEKKKLEKELLKLNINYHKLVMGVPGGTRILINDKKPTNSKFKTAIAIETKRNRKIPIKNLGNINSHSHKRFLLEGGSYAKTFLIKNENKKFVRKIASSKIDQDRGEKVLLGQYKWLRNAKNQGLCVPKVYNCTQNSQNTFFDMQYIENSNLFSEYIKKNSQKEGKKKFQFMVNDLNKFYQKNTETKEKNEHLLVQLIIQKAIPSVQMLKKSNYAKILFNKSIVINKLHCKNILDIFNKIVNGKDIASKNLKNNFDTNKKTIIHGDLTLENILVSKNNLFFIDPLGSFMDIKFDGNFLSKTSPLFDLGKLSQSIISKYEDWKNENDLKKYVYKNEFILKACSKTDKVFFNILVNKFKGITKNLSQIVIMHMIIILCRIIRYRVEKYETSAVLCYLYATYFANLVYKNSNFKI